MRWGIVFLCLCSTPAVPAEQTPWFGGEVVHAAQVVVKEEEISVSIVAPIVAECKIPDCVINRNVTNHQLDTTIKP